MIYYKNLLKCDFGYMTKGIKVDHKTGHGPELMFVGDLRFNQN